jgi:hypothetical protein
MKELEDHKWFPSFLRNFQTTFIGFVVVKFNFYDTFIQYLNGLYLVKKPVTDLCSGGGEPAISIFKKSNCFSSLTLTDKYPNALQLFDDTIFYEKQSIDVLEMGFQKETYYTMFNAFHHFTDKDKLKITREIKASGASAFFVEILEPTLLCFLKVLLMSTIGCLLFTPFIRPFSIKRLFFTYILPINVFTITIDGLLSVIKSRSVKQYQLLFAQQQRHIKILRLKNGLGPIIVIKIQP